MSLAESSILNPTTTAFEDPGKFAEDMGMALRLRAALSSAVAMSAFASAQVERPFEIEAELTVASKYVWRGINLVNDWVIQPGVILSSGPFSVGLWANLESSNWNLPNYTSTPRGRVTELDVTLAYTRTLGLWSGVWASSTTSFPERGKDAIRSGSQPSSLATFGDLPT